MNDQNFDNQTVKSTNYDFKNGLKKSKRKKVIFGSIMIVVIIMVFVGIGAAQKLKNFKDKGPLGILIEKITADLDLSEQQKADVQKIKEEIKTKMEENKSKRENKFDEFDRMFRQDKLDKDAMKEAMKKHEADREAMKDFMLDELIKFHSILTSEQRNKAADKLKEFKNKKPFEHNKDKKDFYENN
jgi:periplasmic protein CpxP/Spy